LLGWPPSNKVPAQRIKYPPKLGAVQAAKLFPANCKTWIAMVSRKLTMEDIPWLHEQWIEEFLDLCGEIPLRLPPLRITRFALLTQTSSITTTCQSA
jgi:hypothetical protein